MAETADSLGDAKKGALNILCLKSQCLPHLMPCAGGTAFNFEIDVGRRFPDATMKRLLLATGVALLAPRVGLPAQSVVQMSEKPAQQGRMEFVRELRVGSLDGPHDSFGRIAFAVLRSDGSILLADDRKHQIVQLDATGRVMRSVGREGKGPGEYEEPWLLASLRADSVLVWDASLARISILTPNLEHARSFHVPPFWVINSVAETPSGDFVLAAYDRNTGSGVQVVSRSGTLKHSFLPIHAPPEVERFSASLLGGRLRVQDSLIIYSHKSPFRVDVLSLHGKLLRSCNGARDTTTDPRKVVTNRDGGAALNWQAYVHATALIPGASPRSFLTLVVDRVNQIHTISEIDIGTCRLVRNAKLPAPLFLTDGRDGRVVGFLEIDYPELVSYRIRTDH